MSSAVEARNMIIEIAGPQPLGVRVKSVLAFVAEVSGISERRIRGIWHREAKTILADEINALKRAREEAVHERNIQTRAFLAARRADPAVGREDAAG
ncbi:hypothetical protein [Xanthobacter agilis]|uniref:UDP-N-acetylmuramyl pentapeptide synthase n=1 Tax=Xanthobacter agilis TaxID=47492 RepID=A0ABU0LFQ8_XANAG|nr:hypothetical protein [Xanthobacter agilis]MDQ0505975.1 UDP-N-acetylmuramyl pentapeptide synthase [Xanthobacter agilis]